MGVTLFRTDRRKDTLTKIKTKNRFSQLLYKHLQRIFVFFVSVHLAEQKIPVLTAICLFILVFFCVT